MIGLLIDAVVLVFLFQKIREFYFYCALTWYQVLEEEEFLHKDDEYINWAKHRLPYLKDKMKESNFNLHYFPKTITSPDPGYGQEIDKETDKTWALAERLARSNHMRKDWNRFGPIEESRYDY